MPRPTPAIEAIPATTPFVGPEELMRSAGRSDLVRLGANESAFGIAPAALAAMTAELPRLSWYGDPESLDLRDALAAKHGCRPSEILVGAGIDDLMGLAVRAFVGAGDGAVATRGTYPTFAYHVTGFGGTLETVDYRRDGSVDLDALSARARTIEAPLVYLANPDNPSGTFHGRESIAHFAASLPPETLLLLDEAYADFVDPEELLDVAVDDRIVRLRTFSKAYGMAGARIGYAVLSQRNAAVFAKIRLQYGVNRNAQIGALASLQDELFFRSVLHETAAARDDYYALARSLGRGYIESRTNFVCIDFETAHEATAIVGRLLERGVWIRKPGLPPLDRYIRVSAGTQPMRRAFADALNEVLQRA
ncbi:MAG TPA: aminotransferase class I/II-fold pyridoxal phosphate-dependent enzyme [Candidatus Tumulicola sp.]|jgi:histidinol-phosphate aminotransferase